MSLNFEKVRRSLFEDADAEEASLQQTFASEEEAGEKEEAGKEAAEFKESSRFNLHALLEAEEDIYAGDVAALQKRIKGSIIKKVPNSGSWQFYEEPELNAQIIIDFLN